MGMSLLQKLYHAHNADLSSVNPDLGDKIVCPICLGIFTVDDIENNKLTDGHVWPDYIRDKSREARSHRVLLCHRCNTLSGSRGDKQMQLREKIKESDENGEFYGERLMKIVRGPANKLIELRVSLSKTGELSYSFKSNWKRNNPKEIERLRTLQADDTKGSIQIHPHHELITGLSEVGWITSGFLFAFYSLGYRYIFQEALIPARNYILESFRSIDTISQFQSSDFGIREYPVNRFPDPEIGIVIPVDGQTNVHLQIDYLSYQISLPFLFVPEVLTELINIGMPDYKDKLQEIIETDGNLYIRVHCTKTEPHDCIWDYVMGRKMDRFAF